MLIVDRDRSSIDKVKPAMALELYIPCWTRGSDGLLHASIAVVEVSERLADRRCSQQRRLHIPNVGICIHVDYD